MSLRGLKARGNLAPLAGELSAKLTEGLSQTPPALRATSPKGEADSHVGLCPPRNDSVLNLMTLEGALGGGIFTEV